LSCGHEANNAIFEVVPIIDPVTKLLRLPLNTLPLSMAFAII